MNIIDSKNANISLTLTWCLYLLRFLLVFMPQTSYLFDDEFLPVVEGFMGRMFNFKTSTSFMESEIPEVSLALPYVTVNWPYEVLHLADSYLQDAYQMKIITPYTLVVAPRLALCMLSFLIDLVQYKTCMRTNEPYQTRMVILASSNCILVHCTHSVINAQETVLFALLLYFVADEMTARNGLVKSRESFCKRLSNTTSKEARKELKRRMLSLVESNWKSMRISLVCVLGVFNRPTFACYAFTPVVICVLHGMGLKNSIGQCTFRNVCKRIVVLIVGAIPPVVILVVADSMFYGRTNWSQLFSLQFLNADFVVAPYNFLEMHLGDSPSELKLFALLTRLVMMYGVLAIAFMYAFFHWLKMLLMRRFSSAASMRCVRFMMFASCLMAPLCHPLLLEDNSQMNLLPMLMPLVYLYAEQLEEIVEDVEKPVHPETEAKTAPLFAPFNLWLGVNAVLVIFNGFVYSAGVVPATMHLAGEMQKECCRTSDYHIVTSNVQNLSMGLFMQPQVEDDRLNVYEMGALPMEDVLQQISLVRYGAFMKGAPCKLYLLLPADRREELAELLETSIRIRLVGEQNFYPHFSRAQLNYTTIEKFFRLAIDALGAFNFASIQEHAAGALGLFNLKLYEIEV